MAMEDIEHWTTRVRSPRTNGFVERTNRTPVQALMEARGVAGVFEIIPNGTVIEPLPTAA